MTVGVWAWAGQKMGWIQGDLDDLNDDTFTLAPICPNVAQDFFCSQRGCAKCENNAHNRDWWIDAQITCIQSRIAFCGSHIQQYAIKNYTQTCCTVLVLRMIHVFDAFPFPDFSAPAKQLSNAQCTGCARENIYVPRWLIMIWLKKRSQINTQYHYLQI